MQWLQDRAGVLRTPRTGQRPQPPVHVTSFHQQTCKGATTSLPRVAPMRQPECPNAAHSSAYVLLSPKLRAGLLRSLRILSHWNTVHDAQAFCSQLVPPTGRQSPSSDCNRAKENSHAYSAALPLRTVLSPQALLCEQSPGVKEEAAV